MILSQQMKLYQSQINSLRPNRKHSITNKHEMIFRMTTP